MPPIDIVCDASVVLKWFHAEGEEDVDASRALLDLHRRRAVALSVLDLTAYEVANALLRGHPDIEAPEVITVLEALAVVCPRLAPTQGELVDAVVLADRHHLTMYDAAYAAVADARHAHLATLDRALLAAGLGRRPSGFLSSDGGLAG
jgi:predicted nucleic acid-binding protein